MASARSPCETRGQANYLLRLVAIAELALTEHNRSG
jgi:hypothetical protein